jgi:hypothetical protein
MPGENESFVIFFILFDISNGLDMSPCEKLDCVLLLIHGFKIQEVRLSNNNISFSCNFVSPRITSRYFLVYYL